MLKKTLSNLVKSIISISLYISLFTISKLLSPHLFKIAKDSLIVKPNFLRLTIISSVL